MTKTPDMTKMFQDMMASFRWDTAAFQNAFKTQAAFAEKFSKVALEAAEKSTRSRPSGPRTRCQAGRRVQGQGRPADYTKSMTDFASAAAEMAAENMAAFAEVAKKVQMETVELMLQPARRKCRKTPPPPSRRPPPK